MEKLRNTPLLLHSMLLVLTVFLTTGVANAQFKKKSSSEFSFSIGGANILSDLGGSPDIGRGFLADFEFTTTHPVVGVYFRQNFNYHFGARVNLYYATVSGNDALIPETELGGNSRKYRNLSFKSPIFEASVMGEINILPYQPGSMRYRFTPYLTAGIGAFYFDPRAKLNGHWVRLQPLGTEGQGLAEFPNKDKYSNIAMCIPFGGGVKFNVTKKSALSFEVAHRMTTTDYIDDVSTYYVDPALFTANYGPTKGALAATLADRTSGERTGATAPGAQRGDPSDMDTYTFSGMLTFSYILGRTSGPRGLYCPKKF